MLSKSCLLYTSTEVFHLNELWISENINYWRNEICRWEKAGIEIVLENDVERSPDLLVDLIRTCLLYTSFNVESI